MELKSYQPNRRRIIKTNTKIGLGPMAVRYVVLILLGVLSVLYLIQTAQGAEKRTEISNQEDQKTEINKKLKTLEIDASRLQSLDKLSNSAATQGLVPTGNITESITVKPTPTATP